MTIGLLVLRRNRLQTIYKSVSISHGCTPPSLQQMQCIPIAINAAPLLPQTQNTCVYSVLVQNAFLVTLLTIKQTIRASVFYRKLKIIPPATGWTSILQTAGTIPCVRVFVFGWERGEGGEQMSKTYFMGYRFQHWHERGLKLSDIHWK